MHSIQEMLYSREDLRNLHLSNGFAVDKNPDGTISTTAPVTAKTIKYIVRAELHSVERSIQQLVWTTMADYLIDLLYTKEDQEQSWFNRRKVVDNIKATREKDVLPLIRKQTKLLFAAVTGLGFSHKKAENIVAGRYINWLGKDHLRKLYGICGTKVSAKAYNMYIRDIDAFNFYYNDPKTRNWVIAVMIALYSDYAMYRSVTNIQDAVELTRYVRTYFNPVAEIELFEKISPKLIRTVYDNYPKQLHTLVALAASEDLQELPSYTISRRMCYKTGLLHPDTIDYAIRIGKSKKHKNQQSALNDVLQYHRSQGRSTWTELDSNKNTILPFLPTPPFQGPSIAEAANIPYPYPTLF